MYDFRKVWFTDAAAVHFLSRHMISAKFGLLMQQPEGRSWFGKFIDTQRVNNQEVDEHIFYRLVQYFAVCLFECVVADDFAPATSIMNMRYSLSRLAWESSGNA